MWFHLFQKMPSDHQFDKLLPCGVNIVLNKICIRFPIVQSFPILRSSQSHSSLLVEQIYQFIGVMDRWCKAGHHHFCYSL